ncbi:uncharacterized protein V6R79_016256 [Siganus canaliculatus]
MKRRETRQNPFKVPDINDIFLQKMDKDGSQKEEMQKFLSLPIHEKTSHAERVMARMKKEFAEDVGEEEEKEKPRSLKQIKSRTVLPKQTPARHELKMAMMKRENFAKESKHDLISMEREKAVLELSLMTKKAEILKMDKAVAKEERLLKRLEKTMERDNLNFEVFLRENEKKSVEARSFFEQEAKSKQKKNAEIKKLTAEIATIQSELTSYEDTLEDYKRYQEFLFKLSPPEWQESQRVKALKAKVLPGEDAQDKQDRDAEGSTGGTGLECEVFGPGGKLPGLPSAHTQNTHPNLDNDSSEYEQEPELYFTHPQQLLDLMTEVMEQNLSLIQSSTMKEEKLERLQKSIETTRKQIEKDEEQIKLQINDMNQKIQKEKERGAKLQQRIQIHVSLNTDDQDVMMDALNEKVAEVYRCCVDDRMTNLSTLEMLANIENRLLRLLESIENIPEESRVMIEKIKDSEKRTRQREEKLQEQKEKQKERMRRYLERSLADAKKKSGRKLMARCMPVAQKVKVSTVDIGPTEDEIHAYLFTAEDTE